MTALDDVSLHVPAGTLTAVIGPSGSGKSSLLAVAATLITPDSGQVVVDGIDTAGLHREELTALRRQRLGIVFQQPNLIASLTALEQLQVMAHLAGGRATVLVTHDHPHLDTVDQVAEVTDGRLRIPDLV